MQKKKKRIFIYFFFIFILFLFLLGQGKEGLQYLILFYFTSLGFVKYNISVHPILCKIPRKSNNKKEFFLKKKTPPVKTEEETICGWSNVRYIGCAGVAISSSPLGPIGMPVCVLHGMVLSKSRTRKGCSLLYSFLYCTEYTREVCLYIDEAYFNV